jgi:hypothetical protein
MRETGIHDPVRISSEIPHRAPLEDKPGVAAITYFFITRAAQRAWEAINQQLDKPRGALFCIGGMAGSGKTHFLNYVIGLSQRAGALNAEPARYLTLVVDAAGRGGNLEQRVIEKLARELSGSANEGAQLWRRLSGKEALLAAFDQARRQGVKAIFVAIDFGDTELGCGHESLETLSALAINLKHPKLTVVIAGRGQPPENVPTFAVAPEDDEIFEVAVERARHLEERSTQIVEDAYAGFDLGDARAVYPFHPASRVILQSRALRCGVARMAQMVREILLPWHARGDFSRLIFPGDLMLSPMMRAAVEERLGENGRIALGRAYDAAGAVAEPIRSVARQAVASLMLHALDADTAALALRELALQIPAIAADRICSPGALAEILREVALRSRGAIVLESDSSAARFNSRAAGGPEVIAFNAAQPLMRRFDSTLTPAQELSEVKAQLKRLSLAMANALEETFRNREILDGALRESGRGLSPDQERHFADFVALMEAGAQRLVEGGADPGRREAALKVVDEYEALATLAGFVPRLRAIREYLAATGLKAKLDDDAAHDQRLTALETECHLLTVAANAFSSTDVSQKFEALEARFQRFKWTYVEYYRSSHELWRQEMDRLAEVLEDARIYIDALRRLDSITALGAPEASGFISRMSELESRIVRCHIEGALSPDIAPRCPDCAFAIETTSPRVEVEELRVQARRGLEAKLARLSQSTVARLIRQHDTGRRLDGFLKMTQATQTDALVRVMDDSLTLYLAQLLEENSADSSEVQPGPVLPRSVIKPFKSVNSRGGRPNRRRGRALKLPPAGGGNLG